MIYGLYSVFLDAEYSPSLFWELSISEINDILESYVRKEERKIKQREAMLKDEIMLLFNQALQIGNIISRMLDRNMVIKTPTEYYPGLFKTTDFTEQGTEGDGDENKLSPEMELHKARMDDFIFRHNMMVNKKEG